MHVLSQYCYINCSSTEKRTKKVNGIYEMVKRGLVDVSKGKTNEK